MKRENILWKQICGGVLIALGVGIYAVYYWLLTWVRNMATAEELDPALVNFLTTLGVGIVFIANWPSILLLGFGIAWWWNAKPMVRVWCYRVLTGFFLAGVGLFLFILFATSGHKHVESQKHVESRKEVQAAAFCYLVAGLLFYWRSRKVLARAKNAQVESGEPGGEKQAITPRETVRNRGKTSFALCNVFQAGGEPRHLWQFDARAGAFKLHREFSSKDGETLPSGLVSKSWGTLVQPKLNVAWLPLDNVFLRVAQFPQAAQEETRTMVEFQLEKLSPIPVTQAVWTMHVLPQSANNLQTVVVTIVERSAVEEHLGKLEGVGFQADRLEVPMVDQLQAASIREDGAWIYPQEQGAGNTALVAWWYGGILQSVDYITLSAEQDRASGLKDQLVQMAWAGEMEGWLTSTPRWHLVAGETVAGEWEPALRQGLDQPVEIVAPLPAGELAALTAKRAAQADAQNNLLPSEFTTRYRQQFVDRLWGRALLAALSVYCVGVAIYLIAAQVLNFQTRKTERALADIGQNHTNALQVISRYQVLKEREDLKYAALECWKAVADLLPEGASLESLRFNDGKKLMIDGTAPAQQVNDIIDFCDKLRKVSVHGKPLFKSGGEVPSTQLNPGSSTIRWSFTLELKRVEIQ